MTRKEGSKRPLATGLALLVVATFVIAAAGVPREKRETIFLPYESAHAPSSEVKSVGLGLYISRTLARAMGGDLEYVYDGTWSRFRLRLPSAAGARPTAETSPSGATISDPVAPA